MPANPVPFSTLSCAELLLPAFCRFLHSSRLRCLLLPLSYLLPSSGCPVFLGDVWLAFPVSAATSLLFAPYICCDAIRSLFAPSLFFPVTVIVKRTFAIRFQKTPVFYHNTPSAFSQRERNRKAAPSSNDTAFRSHIVQSDDLRTCSFFFYCSWLKRSFT